MRRFEMGPACVAVLALGGCAADLTSAVMATNNLIQYEGLYQGQDYTPTITDPGGYLPEVKMTSWLTYYAPAVP